MQDCLFKKSSKSFLKKRSFKTQLNIFMVQQYALQNPQNY